ncbi:hypothetical protein ACER0A_002260 [Haloimpatiens sp. FM7315]|uniref:hypothetical protein n=1 Tax=Haloimpatiens sp. FM7315 TaxID=3298609 RepID=UPI0035A286FE
MATISQEKDLEMLKKNADGTFTKYNPKTKASNVKCSNGKDLESQLADKASREALKDGLDLKTNKSDYVANNAFATTEGASTAYTVTLNPPPTAYADGQQITILPHIECGNNPTLNVNNLGAGTMLKQDGSEVKAGDIKANVPLSLVRVGSNFFIRSEGKPSGILSASVPDFGMTKYNLEMIMKPKVVYKSSYSSTKYPCLHEQIKGQAFFIEVVYDSSTSPIKYHIRKFSTDSNSVDDYIWSYDDCFGSPKIHIRENLDMVIIIENRTFHYISLTTGSLIKKITIPSSSGDHVGIDLYGDIYRIINKDEDGYGNTNNRLEKFSKNDGSLIYGIDMTSASLHGGNYPSNRLEFNSDNIMCIEFYTGYEMIGKCYGSTFLNASTGEKYFTHNDGSYDTSTSVKVDVKHKTAWTVYRVQRYSIDIVNGKLNYIGGVTNPKPSPGGNTTCWVCEGFENNELILSECDFYGESTLSKFNTMTTSRTEIDSDLTTRIKTSFPLYEDLKIVLASDGVMISRFTHDSSSTSNYYGRQRFHLFGKFKFK